MSNESDEQSETRELPRVNPEFLRRIGEMQAHFEEIGRRSEEIRTIVGQNYVNEMGDFVDPLGRIIHPKGHPYNPRMRKY